MTDLPVLVGAGQLVDKPDAVSEALSPLEMMTITARRAAEDAGLPATALAAFCALPQGPLEATENLEQLRWLEAGRRIRVLETSHVPLGIDTREDYDAFVARVRGETGAPRSRGGV